MHAGLKLACGMVEWNHRPSLGCLNLSRAGGLRRTTAKDDSTHELQGTPFQWAAHPLERVDHGGHQPGTG